MKTTSTLALAACIALGAGSARHACAGNLGFKLERDFAVVPGFRNLYFVSYPTFNGVPDTGNMNHTDTTNKCVGDLAVTRGPVAGDGVINALDLLCDSWTDRGTPGMDSQTFTVQQWDTATCTSRLMGGTRGFGGISTAGTPFSLDPGTGYYFIATGMSNPRPRNRAVLVGSHDPNRPPLLLTPPACTPRWAFLNLPYHTMYQISFEILCGLEGVDWEDGADADSNPDDCWRSSRPGAPITTSHLDPDNVPSGVFDAKPGADHSIFVMTWDNVPDGSPSDNQSEFTAVTIGFFGLAFPRSAFDLRPGDSYLVSMSAGHIPTVFAPPHF